MTRLNFERDISQNAFINGLLRAGLIERYKRGWYIIPSRPDLLHSRCTLLWVFGKKVAPGRYRYNREVIEALMQGSEMK